MSPTDDWHWRPDRATETLERHFEVASLDGFGLSGWPLATRAAGGLLRYLADTQRSQLAQIQTLSTYRVDGFMPLDDQTRRNLELTESGRGERRHSLLAVLDQTHTAGRPPARAGWGNTARSRSDRSAARRGRVLHRDALPGANCGRAARIGDTTVGHRAITARSARESW